MASHSELAYVRKSTKRFCRTTYDDATELCKYYYLKNRNIFNRPCDVVHLHAFGQDSKGYFG